MSEQMLNEQMERETAETKEIKNGLATGALVLGILALITTLFFLNYIFGIIGLILAVVYLAKKGEKPAKGKAIAGLVCAAVSIVVSTCIWVGLYVYLTTTGITTLLTDVNKFTGGRVNPETVINEAIESSIADKTAIEQLLGKELNYNTICEFVGEEVSLKTINNFVGDGINGEELKTIIKEVDTAAVISDLGGNLTYKALEEKLGKNFTYDDLKEYLENFRP